MPVQVSYKKQLAIMVMLLITFLAIVEGFVNIWWYNLYTCEFEKLEQFENLDDEAKKQLCLENLELQHTEAKLSPYQGQFLTINSHGFRGPEITIDKPANTYRIFAVGGSTTFGSGISDNESYPVYLQEKFDEAELDFKVQVINAGIPGIGSEAELELIKNRLENYNPDLYIVYDGVNELGRKVDAVTWKERVIKVCQTAKNSDIQTIVILQPFF